MKVAFFAHDAGDAAVRKRCGQMTAEGHDVRLLAFRRQGSAPADGDAVDLGRTKDRAFVQRAAAIVSAVPKARSAMGRPDVVWARNLDAALAAAGALAASGRHVPLVYECLDVHRLASGDGAAGHLTRRLERWVVERSSLLVVSSPAFVARHFEPRYGPSPWRLIENRLSAVSLGERPKPRRADRPLTIGWFGILRCRRSLDLLLAATGAAEGALRLVTAGRPARDQLPGFDERIEASPNARHLGPYAAPDDLADLYGGVDLAWAGDWFQAGGNSAWLLPNRLYEAGWFGVPVVLPSGTEAARWVADRGTGLVVDSQGGEALWEELRTAERGLEALRAAVHRKPGALFAAPPGEVTAALEQARC